MQEERLQGLHLVTGTAHPRELTPQLLLRWLTTKRDGSQAANNTVRSRISTADLYLDWCVEMGYIAASPMGKLPRTLRKQYPATYGKKQGKRPPRWLTKAEAFGILVAACKDGTWSGSRDQLIIRLFLLDGIRCSELSSLTWGDLHPHNRLRWIGKGDRPRSASPGPVLLDLLGRWRRQYERQLGRPITDTDPIICPDVLGATRQGGAPRINWGEPMAPRTIASRLQRRGELSGLGYIAPHDLRRTVTKILRESLSADGGHLYDAIDIQHVMDHASLSSTQRYLEELIDADVKDRAGLTLDG